MTSCFHVKVPLDRIGCQVGARGNPIDSLGVAFSNRLANLGCHIGASESAFGFWLLPSASVVIFYNSLE